MRGAASRSATWKASGLRRRPRTTLPLRRGFYDRPTLTVARDLIGARLVHLFRGRRLAGIITETEAYIGESDLGCHARAGRTPRTEVMYGVPGHAYVYFTYGNHWMLNAVTEHKGFPAAVLIRAVQPVDGMATIARRRHGRDTHGPGKLTQGFAIAGGDNGRDLTTSGSTLWIEAGWTVPSSLIVRGPRVGLNTVPEPWRSKPWRFRVDGWELAGAD
jgi:DNA-3-methyladenine glycosylase